MSRNLTYRAKSIRDGKTARASIKVLAALSAAVGICELSAIGLADTYSNNGGTNLSLPSSWVDDTSPATDGAPPSSNDIAQFDSTTGLINPTTFGLGQSSTSWSGLSILNPGAAVILDDPGFELTDTLTLGASGITVGSQNLTINDAVTIGATQNWVVASGQALTINGIISGSGNSLSFAGAGTSILTGSSQYTGTVAINSGNLVLNYAAANAPASNIINSGATLQLGGGSVTIKAGSSSPTQTFAGVNLAPGATA